MRCEPRIPDFVFAAEAYWDLEWDLQQLGFDYCYDKRLYDRLIHDGPDAIRGHLHADLDYQRRLVRFLENHDEPRAATEFAPAKERAAAVVIATLPGRDDVARRPVRRLACAAAGVPRPAAGRAGRRGAPPIPRRADRRHGLTATWRLGIVRRQRLAGGFQLDATPGVVVDRRRAAITDRDQLRRRAGGGAHPPAVERSRRTDVEARRPPVGPGVRTRRDGDRDAMGCTSSWRRGSSTSSHATTSPASRLIIARSTRAPMSLLQPQRDP